MDREFVMRICQSNENLSIEEKNTKQRHRENGEKRNDERLEYWSVEYIEPKKPISREEEEDRIETLSGGGCVGGSKRVSTRGKRDTNASIGEGEERHERKRVLLGVVRETTIFKTRFTKKRGLKSPTKKSFGLYSPLYFTVWGLDRRARQP